MPHGTPAPPNKRKKPSKIITDLSHVAQDEYESEPEASEFDLGTKIRTPKDIMLEELSLLKNRGSKMFRMRQQRVEKFIYENNPDLFSSESMENFQKLVPSLGGQMVDAGGHLIGWHAGGKAPIPPPKPGSKGAGVGSAGGAGGAGGAGSAGGHGVGSHGHGVGSHGHGGTGERGLEWSPLKGGGTDDPTKKHIHVRTYVSPWEKAMKGDENLLATMRSKMPGPHVHEDSPGYKTFNRTAMPYGGYEKASQLLKFQLPDPEKTKEEPELAIVYEHDVGCRPCFNRTPIGWVGNSEPCSIHMETDAVPFDGETDDL